MMKKYNILWIDDEHENWMEFKILAERASIKLTSFKSFDEGFDYLENNLELIDGVLLDAMFFQSKNQTKGTEDLKGLAAAHRRLIQLESKKFLPRFILSGQTRLDIDNTFEQTYGKHYRKSNLNDIEKLFIDIKDQVDQLPDTQIKTKYRDVFEVYEKQYLDLSSYPTLIDLLRSFDENGRLLVNDDKLNSIRKVLEAVFYACNKLGLLHDKCIIDGVVNQQWASLFLAGKKVDLKDGSELCPSKAHFPKIIARHVKNLIDITGSGSHFANPEMDHDSDWKVNLSHFRKYVHSPYLFQSLVLQLLDVILWVKSYFAENADYYTNVCSWGEKNGTIKEDTTQKDNLVKGTVINKNKQGFAFFQPDIGRKNSYISKDIVSEYLLVNGMKIKAEIEEYADNLTGELKLRVKQVEL